MTLAEFKPRSPRSNWIPALLVLGAVLAGFAYAQGWTPSDVQIAKLESGLKLDQLPRWNHALPPLAGYARYYTGSTKDGDEVILGELVVVIGSSPKMQPGIHIVGNRAGFPRIFDGGCAIVTLAYSVKQQRIISIGCNGFA